MSQRLNVQGHEIARLKSLKSQIRPLKEQLQQDIEGQMPQFTMRHSEMVLVRDVLNIVESFSGTRVSKGMTGRDVFFLCVGAVILFIGLLMWA